MKAVQLKRKHAICYSMSRLRTALEPAVTSALAEEIAFHLAELKPELRQLVALLNRMEKESSITPSSMNAVLYFVDVHWPYHFKELRKLIKNRAIVRYASSASSVERSRSKRIGSHRNR